MFADDGEIYLAMMPGAQRSDDLHRNPQVAIHCPTVDSPANDPATWLGHGKITAVAVECTPDRFRLEIDAVVLTRVAPGGQDLEISTWRAGRLAVAHRRGRWRDRHLIRAAQAR